MQNLILLFELITPVFLIVGLGFFLKKIKIINDNFVSISSKVVFNVSLPALIFVEISSIQLGKVFNPGLLLFAAAATIISFLIVWAASKLFIKEGRDLASFLQGSIRGNFAIIGLAIIANLYGPESLGKASILLAFIIPLYNVLSVIALTVPLRKEKQMNLSGTLFEILKNPLIIAVILAVPFSWLGIELNYTVKRTVTYLSSLTLPLALIGIGGFLSFTDIKRDSVKAFYASVIKLVLIPLVVIYAAYLRGYKGEDLGMLFILFGCPTAIASFVMAEAMGVNSKLAGNILLMTTLGSILTITLGLFILKENGLL